MFSKHILILFFWGHILILFYHYTACAINHAR